MSFNFSNIIKVLGAQDQDYKQPNHGKGRGKIVKTKNRRVEKKPEPVKLDISKGSDELTNFYDELPKKYKKSYHNPSFKKHLMKVPFRALIVGSSGSGKTQLVFELIKRMQGTFNKIILCVKNKSEPLYEWLADSLDKDQLEIYEGADQVPNVDDYDTTPKETPYGKVEKNPNGPEQILAIFDDLVLDRNQDRIIQFFIRGRKISGGISCCYLTQSYYETPKIIRLNCNYLFIKKLSSERDLSLILSEISLGVSKEKLMQIYKQATSEKLDFLMVDVDADGGKRFRVNFLNIIDT